MTFCPTPVLPARGTGAATTPPPTALAPTARALALLAGAWLVTAPALALLAQEGDTATTDRAPRGKHPDFSAFQLIAARNIFNPDRSGPQSERSPREERPPARVESFALAGTMAYEKGRFAFFDGSDSEFRKVLKAGDTIAGFTIQEVRPNEVVLVRNESTVEVKVNSEMRREDEGEWHPAERTEIAASSSGGNGERDRSRREDRRSRGSNGPPPGFDRPGRDMASNSTSSAGSSTSSGSEAGGDASEILKRLMEQRRKETQ